MSMPEEEQQDDLPRSALSSSSHNGESSVDTSSTFGEGSSVEIGRQPSVPRETAASKQDSPTVTRRGCSNACLGCLRKICCFPVWLVLCINAIVLIPIYTMPLAMAVYALSVYFAPSWVLRGILLSYLVYVALDRKTPSRGGWDRDLPFVFPCFRFNGRHFFRSNPLFKGVAYYFSNMKLVKTAELDPQDNHLFLYHPHGVIAMGANTALFTNGASFDKVFPGVDRSGITLNATFLAPLFREFILSIGLMSANRSTLVRQLSKPGKSVCLVPGGATEALHSQPGTCRVYLTRRRGFIKVALETGCVVVPCIGFGENDIFSTFYGGEEYRQLQRIVEYKKQSKRGREAARGSALASSTEAQMPAAPAVSRPASQRSGLDRSGDHGIDDGGYLDADKPLSSRSIVDDVVAALDDLVTGDNAVEDVDRLDDEYLREASSRDVDPDEERGIAATNSKVEVDGLAGFGQTTAVPEPHPLRGSATGGTTSLASSVSAAEGAATEAAAAALSAGKEEEILEPPQRLSWYGRFKAWVFGFQMRVMRVLSFSLPIVTQPIPHPAQMTVVAGAPIRFPKAPTPLSPELVEEYHQLYVQALVDLYNANKGKYAKEGVEIEIL